MSSRKLGLSLVLALMFVFGAWASAFGDTIWVATDGNDTTGDGSEGSPYATIQKGIDEASNEDTVKVKNGTYTGTGNVNLHFDGKAVTLRSENGPENCIIDCGGEYTDNDGFRIEDDEGRDTVIDGFTVRNAGVSEGHHGVYINGASPTITNCIITHNQGVTMSSHYGAGIRAESGSPKIVNCIVKENSTTQGYSGGGGMYIKNCTGAEIINCLVANNKCNQGGGGGIRIYGGAVTIKNCTVVNNDQINGSQGGVYCRGNSVVTLYNTIIWDNKGTQVSVQSGSTVELYNCDCQGGWSGTGSGNIDSDPLFVDAGSLGLGGYGDYHLQSTSPCIDTGDNSHATENTDLDGNPRIVDGNSPPDGTDTVDMGPYEYTPPTVTITTPALDDGDQHQYYSFTVMAVSGTPPYIWSATGLPTDLSINDVTGQISGIPAIEGDFIVSVTVTDDNSESDNKNFPLKIWSATLTITTESLPDGSKDKLYSTTVVEARGGTAPYSWGAAGLPPGLSIDPATGVISGIPTAEGDFNVTVTVTDDVSDTFDKDFTITIVSQIIYIKTDGLDTNNGFSWATAVKTIQKGLDLAIENGGNGWTVEVADGTYNETGLDFKGYSIHLKSVGGAENCIIDGQSSGRVFYFHSSETNEAILDGFTVQNGYLDGTSGVPTNCGAGICCYGGAPTIINCIVKDNTSGYRAGGVYSQDPVKIYNCLIVNNQGRYGGGLNFRSGASGVELVNCTIANNNGTSKGGGAYIRDSGVSVLFANCIVWDNTSLDGPQFYLYSDATLTVTYSDVEGGYSGTGNIDSDPLFANPSGGDYRLQNNSPCVDTGDNASANNAGLDTDLDGNPRISGVAVDVGAYEIIPVFKALRPLCEGAVNPSEVPVAHPHFSAVYGDTNPANHATDYEIEVYSDEQLNYLIWESSETFDTPLAVGERCEEIRYTGELLDRQTPGTYYWQIAFKNDQHEWSEWSDVQHFTMDTYDKVITDTTWTRRHEYHNLTVRNGATLTLDGDFVVTVAVLLHVTENADIVYKTGAIIVAANVTIDFGCSLNADGMGYPAGQGPGAGGSSYTDGGGGGGFGGLGGRGGGDEGGAAGSAYGTVSRPDHITAAVWDQFMGSGGGNGGWNAPGGSGGGIVRLIVTSILTLDGSISANGTDGETGSCGNCGGGGGSGGTVAVSACHILSTGEIVDSIAANAGKGANGSQSGGGGGGGGLVGLFYSLREGSVPPESFMALPGEPGTGGTPAPEAGQPGIVETASFAEASFFLKDEDTPTTVAVLLLDTSLDMQIEVRYVALQHAVELRIENPDILTISPPGYSYIGRPPVTGEYDDCDGLYPLLATPEFTVVRDDITLNCIGEGVTFIDTILGCESGAPVAQNPDGEEDEKSAAILECINTKIHLKKVWFNKEADKYHPVAKDSDGSNFTDDPKTNPHWLDENEDGDADDEDDHKYPVCFTRNTKMRVSATFKTDTDLSGKDVWVRGWVFEAGYVLHIPRTKATEVTSNKIIVEGPAEERKGILCESLFKNEIDIYDPMEISWFISVTGKDGDYHPIGESKNQCYVILPDTPPEGIKLFHTVVHISCKKAEGKTDQQKSEAVTAIWSEFTDRVVKRVSDNKTMTYWKNHQKGGENVSQLLSRSDANGNCEAWSDLFKHCLRVQNIHATRIIVVPKIPPLPTPPAGKGVGLVVKNATFSDPPSGTGDYPYLLGDTNFNPVPGQGNDNPKQDLTSHWLTYTSVTSLAYDPSYGTPPASSNIVWEENHLDGFMLFDMETMALEGFKKNTAINETRAFWE